MEGDDTQALCDLLTGYHLKILRRMIELDRQASFELFFNHIEVARDVLSIIVDPKTLALAGVGDFGLPIRSHSRQSLITCILVTQKWSRFWRNLFH